MSYSAGRVKWEQAAPLLRNIREKVFICEWRIPKKVEFDQNDSNAFHMLVCDDNTQEPIATGRILPTGEISRIAVLMDYRQEKIDRVVLKGLLKIANEMKLPEVYIRCPLDKVPYFQKHNFHTVGNVFMEAGIPRQRMACPITECSMAKYYLSH